MLAGVAIGGRGDALQIAGLQVLQQPAVPTPAQEAAQHGLAQCGRIIDRMAGQTILTPNYTQSSLWHAADPGKHVFQSIAGLSMPNAPPDTFVSLIAAPVAPGVCDGVAMQVIPLAVDCAAAETAVRGTGGQTIFPLRNSKVMLDSNRDRMMLLPGANNTCIALSVKSYFHDDPALAAPAAPR